MAKRYPDLWEMGPEETDIRDLFNKHLFLALKDFTTKPDRIRFSPNGKRLEIDWDPEHWLTTKLSLTEVVAAHIKDVWDYGEDDERETLRWIDAELERCRKQIAEALDRMPQKESG